MIFGFIENIGKQVLLVAITIASISHTQAKLNSYPTQEGGQQGFTKKNVFKCDWILDKLAIRFQVDPTENLNIDS